MKNSNDPRRLKNIEIYNENPRFCGNCNSKIEMREQDRPRDMKKRKFCSKSCSNSFNNIGVKRTKDAQEFFCDCGNKKTRLTNKCKECYMKEISVQDKSLSYFLKDGKYSTTKLTHIRKWARWILERSDREKICMFCKDVSLIPILEVCHVKSIMSFDKTATLREINELSNLAWMCPNHHTLYDKGLI